MAMTCFSDRLSSSAREDVTTQRRGQTRTFVLEGGSVLSFETCYSRSSRHRSANYGLLGEIPIFDSSTLPEVHILHVQLRKVSSIFHIHASRHKTPQVLRLPGHRLQHPLHKSSLRKFAHTLSGLQKGSQNLKGRLEKRKKRKRWTLTTIPNNSDKIVSPIQIWE